MNVTQRRLLYEKQPAKSSLKRVVHPVPCCRIIQHAPITSQHADTTGLHQKGNTPQYAKELNGNDTQRNHPTNAGDNGLTPRPAAIRQVAVAMAASETGSGAIVLPAPPDGLSNVTGSLQGTARIPAGAVIARREDELPDFIQGSTRPPYVGSFKEKLRTRSILSLSISTHTSTAKLRKD